MRPHAAPPRRPRPGMDLGRSSERELADFLENTAVGLHWVGPDGTVLWANQAELELLGYTAIEYVGHNLSEFHADPEVIADILARLARKETLQAYEARLRSKDGSIRHVLISSSAFWEEGRFVHTRCFTRDITDRKRAEEALRVSEHQFRAVFEGARDAMIIADDEGRCVEVNQATGETFGRSRDELLGRTVGDFTPPGLEMGAAWSELLEKGRLQGELVAVRKDGSSRDLEYSATAHILPQRHLLVLRDVTARKRAERLLGVRHAVAALLATAPSLSEAAPRMLRVVCEALGWDMGAVWRVDEGAGALRCVGTWQAPCLEGSAFVEVTSSRLFAPGVGLPGRVWNGRMPVWIPDVQADDNFPRAPFAREAGLHGASGFPFLLGGRCLGAVEFFSRDIGRLDADLALLMDDVTSQFAQVLQRHRAEEERTRLLAEAEEARARAETANRLKDEFLATLSHELRTPLSAIVGWTHLLRSGRLDEVTTDHALATIERNARAQTQLIEDLLDVSRIVTGKLRLDVRPVELPFVVEAALDTVRPTAEAKGVRLQAVLDPAASPVAGDPDRLQQVVWNLLSNAIKFTPREGRVTVRLARVNSHVEIAVQDTGVGIAPSFLPSVFARFSQGDPSSTRAHQGLGLGLAIVRHLVELHGGAVRADSAGEGQGATFTVTLPLMSVDARRRPDVAAVSSGAASLASPDLAGVRVLVVDDEPDALDLLAALLRQKGATVFTAGAADDGLELLRRQRPDVLVSDIEMPQKDGYVFMRAVRALSAEEGGRTPAAALTAYARTQDRLRALLAGFQIHLPKPVDPAELVSVVASLVGRTGRA